jgi:two-component system nitrogen regulation response regulator NtrX
MKILIVDDEADIRESLSEIFIEDGYEVICAGNEKDAISAAINGVDLAIVDIKLGSDNGIDVLRKLKSSFSHLPVIMITGFGTVSLAKEAFQIGAHDFLEKPLRLIQVRTSVRNALEGVSLKKQLVRKEQTSSNSPVIVSDAMKQLYTQASKLSNVKESVVIMGPSGSGKDLLARHLHYDGVRAQGPFIVSNAASLPVNLAEDEFFGHEKGAFTGADRKREGCFELANNGTLFIDEIGDMDLQVQAKVLRVLESGEFVRLGGSSPIKVNVRLVCATHKNLESLVESGRFRHDLWYRISAFVLNIPGLDRRKDDIIPLAQHFLRLICSELGIEKKFTDDALSFLSESSFPGNVRELKHLITRTAVYSDSHYIQHSDIEEHHNGPTIPDAPEKQQTAQSISSDFSFGPDFKTAKLQFEKEYLVKALSSQQGNITATARLIGMAQSNLSRKLKELGIEYSSLQNGN